MILVWILLSCSLLSVWWKRDPRVWGSLLGMTLLTAMASGTLFFSGLLIVLVWAALWIFYVRKKSGAVQLGLFLLFLAASFGFKFHLLPGFYAISITPQFHMRMDTSLLGIFPLALLVPLASTRKEWKKALRGTLIGCLGIALLALAAVLSGAIEWKFKLPTHAAARYWSNLIFTAIPEEGFYRGFVQNQLCRYMGNTKKGKWIALIATSLIFTLAHIYWSPSLDILAFVFLAGLLYGGVYLISGKIESAILTHFLLNFIHMTFFSYHAM